MQFRYILRRLARSPMFSVIAVLTVAIGIGANTAIFSVIEGILLKPLPYPHPERLIAVDHTAPGVNIKNAGAAPFLFFSYKDESRTLERVALWSGGSASVTGLAQPQEERCIYVTADMLPVLQVSPVAGRVFSDQDDKPGAPETVLLTYGYWQSNFGGSPAAIGRKLMVDGHPTEIIGVLPAAFRFLDEKPALLLPLRLDRAHTFLGNFSFRAIGRLKPGITIQQASHDTARIIPAALRKFPPFPGFSVKMFEQARIAPLFQPLKESVTGDIGEVLWVLMGTIALVLLIACANVANLLLVRADSRQQELAVRAALGAGWKRIARELMTESMTLGLLGGALGLLFAFGAIRLVIAMAPANLPRLDEISIDLPVLLFTAAISLLSGLGFGLIPVLRYTSPSLSTALRAGGRTSSQSRERHRARSVLVVVQVSLALVLLISSGLMFRTFQALRNVEPGFTAPQHVQTLRISVPEMHVKDPLATIQLHKAILEGLTAISGISSVAFASSVPLTGQGWHDPIFAEDQVYSGSKIPALRSYNFVSPGFSKALGARMIAGREFTWTDIFQRRNVAMVTENVARELWGSPSAAIGKRIRESLKGTWREVVGVLGDLHADGLNVDASKMVFWPPLMHDFAGDKDFVRRSLAFFIRSPRSGSANFVDEVRRAVWSVDPDLPLAEVRTLQEVYDKSLARTSFTLTMLGLAGCMALLLGVVGIYGVISYSVSQRTREIGIRMALGARNEQLTYMFIGDALRLTGIGVICGLAVAFAVVRVLHSLLFGVSARDPVTYVLVCFGLIFAAGLASYLPALRASAVDPVNSLRAE